MKNKALNATIAVGFASCYISHLGLVASCFIFHIASSTRGNAGTFVADAPVGLLSSSFAAFAGGSPSTPLVCIKVIKNGYTCMHVDSRGRAILLLAQINICIEL